MPTPTVTGIFDSLSDAEKVTEELLEAGIARHRIVISLQERQGERYEPIVGKLPDPDNSAEAARSGPCVVSVAARSHVDKKHIAALMRRHGARGTVEGRS
jgi:hypothetical protein